MHTFDAPIRIADNLQLGDPLFSFTEIEPPPPALVDQVPAPFSLVWRVNALEDQVKLLERRLADLESRTLTARWHRFLRWVQAYWR